MLAETEVGHAATVHATLKRVRARYAGELAADQRTQLFIVRGADVGPLGRGGQMVAEADDLFLPSNVIAAGTLVRTSDDREHPMSATLPPQTRTRDYYVYFEQTYSPRCLPRKSIWTAGMIGLVRVEN